MRDLLIRLLGLERYFARLYARVVALEKRVTALEQQLANRWQS